MVRDTDSKDDNFSFIQKEYTRQVKLFIKEVMTMLFKSNVLQFTLLLKM